MTVLKLNISTVSRINNIISFNLGPSSLSPTLNSRYSSVKCEPLTPICDAQLTRQIASLNASYATCNMKEYGSCLCAWLKCCLESSGTQWTVMVQFVKLPFVNQNEAHCTMTHAIRDGCCLRLWPVSSQPNDLACSRICTQLNDPSLHRSHTKSKVLRAAMIAYSCPPRCINIPCLRTSIWLYLIHTPCLFICICAYQHNTLIGRRDK